MSERRGDWISTFSGTKYWPADPRPEDVSITDIAHALSMVCRFAGHCREFYSVAEHSVLVSQVVPEEFALLGLLHDAAEAYIGDVSRPLKGSLPDYRRLEARNWEAISIAFDLPLIPPIIHVADNAVLFAERAVLLPNSPAWGWSHAAAKVEIEALPPAFAKQRFLDRFHALTVGRSNLRCSDQAPTSTKDARFV